MSFIFIILVPLAVKKFLYSKLFLKVFSIICIIILNYCSNNLINCKVTETNKVLVTELTKEILKKANIISKFFSKIKILGTGEIKSKVNLNVDYISKSAKEKLEKGGGTLSLKNKN